MGSRIEMAHEVGVREDEAIVDEAGASLVVGAGAVVGLLPVSSGS